MSAREMVQGMRELEPDLNLSRGFEYIDAVNILARAKARSGDPPTGKALRAELHEWLTVWRSRV